ncbi:DNA-directed RNA polymerase III subunit RPC5-like isoform X2 [Artemia franciscana]|uniref:DNA-directed RNA polymerase III subunit RPC5-like isoform X2 n=1 Tax=Artemia franciscana TaxID=6661 RepID=UPI0032DA0169
MDLKEGTKIPIYITPQDGDQVKVFNYLMKNAKVTKSLPISKVRVKPNQDLTELRLDLRQETQYFSFEKAQEIADTSGLFKKEATPDEQPIMDSVLMKSSPCQLNSNYVLGLFKDNSLILTKVGGISNISTDFSYLHPAPEQNEEQEMVLVTKKFKRSENEKMKKTREKQIKEEAKKREPWWDLTYGSSSTEFAQRELDRLFSTQESQNAEVLLPKINIEEYELSFLKAAHAGSKESVIDKEQQPLLRRPLSELKKMKIQDMIKSFLLNVKVTSFSSLLSTLTLNDLKQSKEALHCLHDCAVLVQGNWVISSEVLYPEGTLCGVTGMPAKALAKARTFILLLFAHEREVKRTFVTTQTRLPSEEVTAILEQFSARNCKNMWEFSLPTDTEFIRRHHEDVKKQNFLWNKERETYEKEKYKIPSKALEILERKRSSSSRMSSSEAV